MSPARDEEAGVRRRRTTSRTPPTSVATTGRPARQRLDHRDGRALVGGGERDGVERRVELRDALRGSRRSGSAVGDAELAAPSPRATRAAARRRRARGWASTPRLRISAKAASRSSARLISVIRPSQPTRNARRRARRARRERRRVLPAASRRGARGRARAGSRRSSPAGATLISTRSSRTSGLTAISASDRARERAARSAGSTRVGPA